MAIFEPVPANEKPRTVKTEESNVSQTAKFDYIRAKEAV